jgi:hypothetical protein
MGGFEPPPPCAVGAGLVPALLGQQC